MGRRRFGLVRKLPSGRWQASFLSPDGYRQTAPSTFRTRADADRWLTLVEADLSRGTWRDEQTGTEQFGDYARRWLQDNPKIGPRWRETCERNLRLHLAPLVGTPLVGLSASAVREWHSSALRGTGGRTSIAQSYRFLRAVMNAAVREGALIKNPCQIPGAGVDRAKERPVASPAQVVALVEAINARYRAAVLLAAWCGLRRGEIIGLAREDINLTARTVTVRRSRVELLESGARFDGPPKTKAGRRTVTIPPHILPVLQAHLDKFAGLERMFVAVDGSPMRGDALRQAFDRAREAVGMPGFRFHDLRHTGQTLAAATGATVPDLMLRLGHASPAAAHRYMHAVQGRDAQIANALSEIAAHGDAARLPRTITGA
jgi:integrase